MADSLLSGSILRSLAETADGEEHFGVHISYVDLYACVFFLAAIYAGGILTAKLLSMPALVGEIFIGIILGPNLLDLVPNVEAFVMLGEIGLILLVLEAGIDIDLTTLKLIGGRGMMIALVGTFLPVILAFVIAYILGYRGVAAIAVGCTFAPTSLGIAMNVLRRSNIVNTPVGQLIVAAAIIDDMVALVILSQLQAFAEQDVTFFHMMIPVVSALGFLIIGGYLAVFVLPRFLNWFILDRIEKDASCSREWMSLAILLTLLLVLIPATYAARASPLMGAFLAGLVFCSSADVHHMFVSQFKRVMQWLLRIFFAASIGFQVPIQKFGNVTVIVQGLIFTLALLGKVAVGFMVPNFSPAKKFKDLHLRDCLVVGFSMAAEGEFAFVIAVFAVTHNMISQELYASAVLAVLLSTILSPFLLRFTISYFNKQIESTIKGAGDNPDEALKKGIKDQTALFFCIQTKSEPAWGLQNTITTKLIALKLDVIDHRSWHPRQSKDILVNEIYAIDAGESLGNLDKLQAEKRITTRIDEITQAISKAIGQADAIIRVQRWFPALPEDDSDEESQVNISDHIVRATATALEHSMKRSHKRMSIASKADVSEGDNYVIMDEGRVHDSSNKAENTPRKRQINSLDAMFKGKLDGLFRRDRQDEGNSRNHTGSSDDESEMLDVHGVGTGQKKSHEKYDVHGASLP